MNKWDYMTLVLSAGGFAGGKIDAEELNDRLNKLGSDGWELVSIFETNMYQGQTRDVFVILKRPTS